MSGIVPKAQYGLEGWKRRALPSHRLVSRAGLLHLLCVSHF